MFGRGPLNEHFCKSFVCSEIAVNVNFNFYSFPMPIVDMCDINLVRISFMVSEEMSFKNVDGPQTDNRCLPIFQLR